MVFGVVALSLSVTAVLGSVIEYVNAPCPVTLKVALRKVPFWVPGVKAELESVRPPDAAITTVPAPETTFPNSRVLPFAMVIGEITVAFAVAVDVVAVLCAMAPLATVNAPIATASLLIFVFIVNSFIKKIQSNIAPIQHAVCYRRVF